MYHIDEHFYEPEVRDGFLVTSKRKRVWAKELEILFDFDRVCKKYGLKYRLNGGSLIGAIRHGGFIPWDDDLDVDMTREDYEIARRVMPEELGEEFEWQDLSTNLAKCSFDSITVYHRLPFAKVRNRNTTAIEPPPMPSCINQGIWMDIFPLDDALDDKKFTKEMLEMEKELYVTILGAPEIQEYMLSDACTTVFPKDDLRGIMQLPHASRYEIYEKTLISFIGTSTKYSIKYCEILGGLHQVIDKELYEEVTEVPFEGFMVPVPVHYHEVLTHVFGDYMTPVRSGEHSAIFNPDVSYIDYFKNPTKYTDMIKLGADD